MQYQSDNERGSPEDNIVMLAIKEAAQLLSHKATKLKLKEIYPHWDISLKVTKVREEELERLTRDKVLHMVRPVHGRRASTNVEALEDIQRVLQDGEIQEPLVLYSRKSDITTWYYQIFYTVNKDDDREQNQILCTLFPRNTTIRGEAVIVKNGTQFDCRNEKWDINSCELGKTLWWYLKERGGTSRTTLWDCKAMRNSSKKYTNL
ncbi:hypothetical protein C8R48DRAFT_674833 [Suillus tomentosus]|nr:hypothetical protein C8R48DRAFT_674833 [Suillus tomentosus]